MTEILAPTPGGIAAAAALLRQGRLVAFGTETVYGLGADATNDAAVAGVFAAKGRPHFNPLICHYASADGAFTDVVASPTARLLAEVFWPGPLTLVLPRRGGCQVSGLAGAGLASLAVRVPAHPMAGALLRTFGGPVAAPSANPSGRVSPTSAAHVLSGLGGKIAAILDSGPCQVGLESTVLDLCGPVPVLLRPGGVALEALAEAIGPVQCQPVVPDQAIRAPGMLRSHYAPVLPLRTLADDVAPDEALLAFGPPLPGAGLIFQLSEAMDMQAAAARLFEGLRWLDAQAAVQGLTGIAAMHIPDSGLGLAINDRLSRAAAPR